MEENTRMFHVLNLPVKVSRLCKFLASKLVGFHKII